MIVVLALLGLAAIVLQMVLPKLPLMEVHPFLVALPVLYGAMRMGGFRPYYLAIGLGLAIDLLSPQKFGTGALVLSVLVVLVRVQRANFPFDLYGSVALLALLATFGALLLDYLLFCWQSGNWDWRFPMWVRMIWVAVVNLVLAVPFAALGDLVLVRWLHLAAPARARDYAL